MFFIQNCKKHLTNPSAMNIILPKLNTLLKNCEGNKTQFQCLRESAGAVKPMSCAVCITHPGVFRLKSSLFLLFLPVGRNVWPRYGPKPCWRLAEGGHFCCVQIPLKSGWYRVEFDSPPLCAVLCSHRAEFFVVSLSIVKKIQFV